MTYCSQCGKGFGPGDHGFSHCVDHKGKKVVEEAAEPWMAAEHEGHDRAAEEISQLLYHVQVMMLASKVSLEDVYRRL